MTLSPIRGEDHRLKVRDSTNNIKNMLQKLLARFKKPRLTNRLYKVSETFA